MSSPAFSDRAPRLTSRALPNLDRPPPLPFPAGQSPFHIKGTVLWGLFEYVREHIPGGIEAVKQRLSSDELREFSSQTFVAAGWYDFLPVLHILAAAGAAAGLPASQFIAEHAAWQSLRDVHGVHRLLLKLASPEAVAKRFPIAFARYFDFAAVEAEVEKGRSQVNVRGLPVLLFDWYTTSVGSAAAAMLELAGARQLSAKYSSPVEDGQKSGIKTVSFEVVRTWKR